MSSEWEFTVIYLAAIKAIRRCHEKGYICVDLNLGNLVYNEENDLAHVLDGGLSAKVNEPLPDFFKKILIECIEQLKKKSRHLW